MKKSYKLANLDCANCAAKMERAIQKIEGVQGAAVQFLTQRLTLEAEESHMERILAEAEKIVSKIEPACKIIL